MVNTLVKNNKIKYTAEKITDEVFLLPRWEKIKSFPILRNMMFLGNNTVKINLYRKFSAKNGLEKYCLKFDDGRVIANMDLKIYKDCVYIINLDIKDMSEQSIGKLIQTAVEKALYNTTDKKVYINIQKDFFKKSKIKKILLNNEFALEKNQSKYEKDMFGETLILDVENSEYWTKKVQQNPILINK